MIDLILAGLPAGDSIRGVDLLFDALWHVAHRARVARNADLVFRRICEDIARGAGVVGQAAGSDTARSLCLHTELVCAGCRSTRIWVELRSTGHHHRHQTCARYHCTRQRDAAPPPCEHICEPAFAYEISAVDDAPDRNGLSPPHAT